MYYTTSMESDLSIDYAVAIGLKKGRNSLSWCSAKHWILLFIFPGAGKNSKSAKVFSTLSWSWSFKSQQSNSESSILNSSDTSVYGYHGKTLEKLYDEEQKLYKLVKVNYWTPSIICGWSIFHELISPMSSKIITIPYVPSRNQFPLHAIVSNFWPPACHFRYMSVIVLLSNDEKVIFRLKVTDHILVLFLSCS